MRPAIVAVTALLGLTIAGCTDRNATDGGDANATPQPTPEVAPEPTPATGKTWEQMYDAWTYPAPLPPFELIDQDGKKFSLARYEDAYVVVGFVFTRCSVPDACPLIMKKMRDVQQQWAKAEADGKTGGKRLELLSCTIDPGIDTPKVFRDWGAKFGVEFSNWTLATGPIKLMEDALPSLFNVLALPDSTGSISHTVKVAALKPGLWDLAEWRNNEFEAEDVIKAVLEDDSSKQTQG